MVVPERPQRSFRRLRVHFDTSCDFSALQSKRRVALASGSARSEAFFSRPMPSEDRPCKTDVKVCPTFYCGALAWASCETEMQCCDTVFSTFGYRNSDHPSNLLRNGSSKPESRWGRRNSVPSDVLFLGSTFGLLL